MAEDATLGEGEGGGLAVGMLDVVLLVSVVVGAAVLVMRCRGRGKKEYLRKVSVPLT